jgi:hypothetical protein
MLVMISTRVIGVGEYQISPEETDVIVARCITSGSAGPIGSGRATGDLRIQTLRDSYKLTWRHRRENVTLPAVIGEVAYEGIGFATGDRTMVLTYWMTEKVSSAIEFSPLL